MSSEDNATTRHAHAEIKARAWTEFMDTVCCVCAAKPPENGFCKGCYFKLPKAMQRPLWRFGEGYEFAHQAARAWLEKHKGQPVPA